MEIPKKVNLLHIEDDKSSADIVHRFLELAKYTKFQITHVETLEEGINCLDNNDYDVVLLDMILPNSKGIETFVHLHESYPDIPVVITSGYDDLGCEAVKLGAQDFLPKVDLNTGIIVRSIKYAIERRKLELEKNSIQQMYQEIVESTHAAIYEICFEKDRLTYVNDVMCQLTGWTREELLNMGISNLLTDESKLLWLQRYQAMLDGKVVPNTVEYEVNVKNGLTKWVLLTASYKLGEDGNVRGARVIALDITDRKMAKLESQYKEQLVYNELERRLITWRQESQENRQVQERQLRDMGTRIMSINNGVV